KELGMTVQNDRIGRIVVSTALALGSLVLTGLATAQTPSPVLLVVEQGRSGSTQGKQALAIVDPLTGKVVGRVPVGGHPHQGAVSEDGKFAFTGNNAGDNTKGTNSSISVVDVVAQKEIRRFDLLPGTHPHGMFFAAGKLYFTSQLLQVLER